MLLVSVSVSSCMTTTLSSLFGIQEPYYIIIRQPLQIDVSLGSLLHFQVVHVYLYVSVLHNVSASFQVSCVIIQYENKATTVD